LEEKSKINDNKEQNGSVMNDTENNDIKAKELSYDSGEIMLNIILKEYEFELERNKGIQSRTGMLLGFVGAILVLIPTIIKVPDLKRFNVTNALEAFPVNALVLSTLLSFVFLILSIIYFVRVISVEEYKRIDFNSFTKKHAKEEYEKMATALMIKYKDIVSYNHKINTEKVKLYKKGTYMILIALFILSISVSLSLFI